jgi:hypothetical protein
MMICGSHFPWPGLGKIASDGAGYALTTVQSTQLPLDGANWRALFGRAPVKTII